MIVILSRMLCCCSPKGPSRGFPRKELENANGRYGREIRPLLDSADLLTHKTKWRTNLRIPKKPQIKNELPSSHDYAICLIATRISVAIATAATSCRSEFVITASVSRAIPEISRIIATRVIAKLRREFPARWGVHDLSVGALCLLWTARIFRLSVCRESDRCMTFSCWCDLRFLFSGFFSSNFDSVLGFRCHPTQTNDGLETRWCMEQVANQSLNV